MLTFLARRIIASLIVLLAASYIVYVLAANSGDPLDSLRQSTAKNKEALIEQRISELQLDVPAPLRYFLWLGGLLKGVIGQLDLGQNLQGREVTDLVASAAGVTIQLLIASTVLAIILGVLIGITSALRQYSGYDYTVTFLSFLFFSLPSFFLAVVLKAYVGIAFNDFLVSPSLAWYWVVLIALVVGFLWMGILGGSARRRLTVFGVAAVVTFGVLEYVFLTDWLNTPSLGPVVITVIALAIGFLITALTAGLQSRRALYAALVSGALVLPWYFVMNSTGLINSLNVWSLLGFAVIAAGVGLVVGLLFSLRGGYDKWQYARAGAITAVLASVLIVIDRLMQAWPAYSNSDVIHGRPIGTVGAQTPDLASLTSSFWILSLDNITHLLLPTISLMLISLAAYSRYSRANLLDVMNQDYIRTARAKGLNERTVVMRHAFRNALIPLTTIVAFDIGGLIGGAIITETVFAWSGMGKLFNDSLHAVDVNPIMGFFLLTGIVAVAFNIIADLAYSALDPRIKVTV